MLFNIDYISYIGYFAQLCFSLRIIVQWITSEHKHKVVSPTLFWVFSLIGSAVMFIYGMLRSDFSIILGQFISYYVYIGNLNLKNIWKTIPFFLRILLLILPVAAVSITISNMDNFINKYFISSEIPLWLIILGCIGQVIFTCRFVYQWLYSYHHHESILSPTFWWISVTVSIIIIIYAIIKIDDVLIIGQMFGIISYIRNLMIGKNTKKADNEKKTA
ncbi:MAG: lipid-A-disaccharide synthase N-terminal domain-containing protein [Bacteroidaceae bacterium]|nr:lipid-A-disaccharide synthase N-terminal domain-containing protein [Bacteroidaceae bacterium]